MEIFALSTPIVLNLIHNFYAYTITHTHTHTHTQCTQFMLTGKTVSSSGGQNSGQSKV